MRYKCAYCGCIFDEEDAGRRTEHEEFWESICSITYNICPSCGEDISDEDEYEEEEGGRRMTNFEKFINTFGFAPNTGNCLTDNPCCLCPICVDEDICTTEHKENWWHSEYKEKEK